MNRLWTNKQGANRKTESYIMEKQILLVDGHSIINRAYYALLRQAFSNRQGVPTGAIFGFFNIVGRYVDELRPSHMCVAFDRREPTFRHTRFKDYKANRSPMPDDLHLQVDIVKEILDAMPVKRVELAGFEADDVLGTLAKSFGAKGFKVFLLSGDKDNFQLADDQITIIMPEGRQTGGGASFYDPAKVYERYGVTPLEFIEVKALMGDPSDNIPGVKGIGEKGASNLIAEFGSVDNLYAHLDELKPGMRKKLEVGKELAYLSLDLSRIDTAAPLDLSENEALLPDHFRGAELSDLLNEYELKGLAERWLNTGVTDQTETTADRQPDVIAVDLPAALARLASGGGGAATVSAAVGSTKQTAAAETLFLAGFFTNGKKGDLVSPNFNELEPTADIYFSFAGGEVYHFSPSNQAEAESFFSACCQKPGLLAAYDLKPWFRYFGTEPHVPIFDFSSAAYLLNKGTGRDLTPEKIGASYGLSVVADDPINELAVAPQLLQQLREELSARTLDRLSGRIDMPLVTVLGLMEHRGFNVDRDRLQDLSEHFANEIAELEAAIYQEVGHEFKINSPKQLGQVLYGELALPPGRKSTSGQYSTDNDEMERLKPLHPVIEDIVAYRQKTKLKSTFVDSMSNFIEADGRIHCHFNQNLTTTGRLSSSEPNLQNIPIRQAEGRAIRRAFTAAPGKILIDADYSQIELRLLAHLSGDERMCEAFRHGADIHMTTALRIFGVEPDQVTKTMRSAAKTVNFSIIYGISEFGLAKDLGISMAEAGAYIEGYYAQYPKVRSYMEGLVAFAAEHGYVETLFGRRRYIPELKAKNRNQRMFGERAAMNMPVQGTAADLMRLAMVRVHRSLLENGLETGIISQVHDELILEAPVAEAERAAEILRREMEEVYHLDVPLTVDLKIGSDWHETM